MKTFKEGHEKIQEICDALRRETLEPAKAEADAIIQAAHERARAIIEEAEIQAQHQLDHVRKKIEQEQRVFQTSLAQASRQSLEALRQEIENSLFNEELTAFIVKETAKPDVVAKLISAIVKEIEKNGIHSGISAVIPKAISTDEVNQLLAQGVAHKLQEKGVVLGNIKGGALVKLHDKQLTIDITDHAIKELLAAYLRKDFRKLIFS